jgi:hypothetical protein
MGDYLKPESEREYLAESKSKIAACSNLDEIADLIIPLIYRRAPESYYLEITRAAVERLIQINPSLERTFALEILNQAVQLRLQKLT